MTAEQEIRMWRIKCQTTQQMLDEIMIENRRLLVELQLAELKLNRIPVLVNNR